MTTRRGRRIGALIAAAAVALGLLAVGPGTATAEPPPLTTPEEFQLDRYTQADPATFRSLAYQDNGRSFLRAGRWVCQIDAGYGSFGCQGSPATAPPNTLGASVTSGQSGPHWVRTGFLQEPNYRFGSAAGFRAPTLVVGSRVTIKGVTCTAPRPDVVACRSGERGLIFTPAWHKFFYPSWDSKRAHSPNPAPRYLPPRLQYWNQLPQ